MSPETETEPEATPALQQSWATDTVAGSSGLAIGIETQGSLAHRAQARERWQGQCSETA